MLAYQDWECCCWLLRNPIKISISRYRDFRWLEVIMRPEAGPNIENTTDKALSISTFNIMYPPPWDDQVHLQVESVGQWQTWHWFISHLLLSLSPVSWLIPFLCQFLTGLLVGPSTCWLHFLSISSRKRQTCRMFCGPNCSSFVPETACGL